MSQSEMQQEYEEVAVTLEECKKAMALAEKVDRLYQNPDFKEIFVEGYFRDTAARLTGLLGDKEINSNPLQRENVIRELTAVGLVQDYLRVLTQLGNHAFDMVREYEEAGISETADTEE